MNTPKKNAAASTQTNDQGSSSCFKKWVYRLVAVFLLIGTCTWLDTIKVSCFQPFLTYTDM